MGYPNELAIPLYPVAFANVTPLTSVVMYGNISVDVPTNVFEVDVPPVFRKENR
jgi:hypothetical protein